MFLLPVRSLARIPRCLERARREADRIYRTGQGPRADAPTCLAPTGAIGSRHIGPIRLGTAESRTRQVLGAPIQVKRGFLRDCLAGGGSFLVGENANAAAKRERTGRRSRSWS